MIRPLGPCSFALLILVITSLLASCGGAPGKSVAASDWHEFLGLWTATGSRHWLQLGADRRASVGTFQGSIVLSGPSRPDVGFRADALVFNDSATGMLGRAVWTDEHGDKAFSEFHADPTAENKILGTFIGGTGRYSGASGSYEFSWRFVLEGEDGTVQGQSLGLHGRVHVGPPDSSSPTGGPRP